MASFVTRVTAELPNSIRLHPSMLIETETGKLRFTVPYAPQNISFSGISPDYDTVPRPGRQALLLRNNSGLPTISFDLILIPKNGITQNVESMIKSLRALAGSSERLKVSYSVMEAGLWRITGFGFESVQRASYTNAIVRATANITMTRASDVKVNIGPVSGGVKKPVKPGVKPSPSRTYIIRSGDTLSGIAIKFYQDASKWKTIAVANKITDVRTIKVGYKLVIPSG